MPGLSLWVSKTKNNNCVESNLGLKTMEPDKPVPSIPAKQQVELLIRNASKALEDRVLYDSDRKEYRPRICAICDVFATVDNPMVKMPVSDLVKVCQKTNAERDKLVKLYPDPEPARRMIETYRIQHPTLSDYTLSPMASISEDANDGEVVDVCQFCSKDCQPDKPGSNHKPPKRALWNGYCTGETPPELQDLNIAELAMISPNRLVSHAAVLYADQHRGIHGWHAMYENDPDDNVETVQELIKAGLGGEIYVVLCGPWTSTKKALAKQQYTVRADKMKKAFDWLKKNNFHFKDCGDTSTFTYRQPVIIEDKET